MRLIQLTEYNAKLDCPGEELDVNPDHIVTMKPYFGCTLIQMTRKIVYVMEDPAIIRRMIKEAIIWTATQYNPGPC